MTITSLRDKALLSLPLAVVVLGALTIYADAGSLVATLLHFRWEFLLPILVLTSANYALRFLKWQFYLGLIGVRGLGKLESLLLFLSGFSMVITPGKIGEWLKAYLLRERTGTPFSRSAPIVFAERLTDGIAMLVLASGGFLLVQTGWQILLVTLVVAIVAVAVTQNRPFSLTVLRRLETFPIAGPRIHHLREFYESSYVLLSLPSLLTAIAIGTISWGGECVAYYLVFLGLGLEPGWMLLVQATFMLAVASIAGALALLPGGLGVAEGGLTAMAQLLLGLSAERAAASALLIRFCTLWFGLGLGVIALILITRRGLRALAQTEAPG